jgi:hypothetical protein
VEGEKKMGTGSSKQVFLPNEQLHVQAVIHGRVDADGEELVGHTNINSVTTQ